MTTALQPTPAPEDWRTVPDFPDYKVSKAGRIVSTKRAKPKKLSGSVNDKGYLTVSLCRAGQRVNRPVHQIVAAAFIGERPTGHDVRHLDGDKLNNSAGNLRYGTRSENISDQVRHGVHHKARRTHCPHGHPYDEANTRRYKGGRFCITCQRAASAASEIRRRMAKVALPADEAANQLATAGAR